MGKKIRETEFDKENCSPRPSEITIRLGSSSNSDFIECSILDEYMNNLKRNPALKTPLGIHSPKSPCKMKQLGSGGSNFNIDLEASADFMSSQHPRNPKMAEEKANFSSETPSKYPNFVINKLISTLKRTPEGPYLTKSKLRNIEQWLEGNAVETINTPPFANLSVTPVNSIKKRVSSRWRDNGEKIEDSSLDSEVEGVLKAVYGDDWKRENDQRRARTEPRKKTKKFLSPASLKKRKGGGGFCSARRNILQIKGTNLNCDDVSDGENNLDDSVISGVKIINSESSHFSFKHLKNNNLKTLRSEKKNENDINMYNSLDSLRPSPIRKKKTKIMPFDKANSQRQSLTASTDTKNVLTKVSFRTSKKTFLASLSVSTPTSRCHPDAQYYKVNFKSKKEELVKKLYKLFNKEVFDGKLAEDMNFSWNVKLRGTAGYCYNKRITKSTGEVLRQSRIEFSSKIVDRADRLRDTMIHELCHASSWVIDGVLDGHGKVWSKWASKAMERFPELPEIKRCHNYEIVSKYVYRCTCCGYSIKRHSKSINTERKRCGHCYGVLELLINKKRKGKGETPAFDTTRTLPTPNKFAMFVKENYHSVKSSKTNAKHSEIMKSLSEQYALLKTGSKSGKISSDQ